MKRLAVLLTASLMILPTGASAEEKFKDAYENTGNPRADIVAHAKTQIGYTELYRKDGEPIEYYQDGGYTKYGEKYYNQYGAWCGYFILWCADMADIPNSVICSSASMGNCELFVSWFKNTGEWHDTDYEPEMGDIVFFDRTKDGAADHAGIVTGRNPSTGEIYTIEGNSGGYFGYTVKEQIRRNNIIGYGAPDYELIRELNGELAVSIAAYDESDGLKVFDSVAWQGDKIKVLCRDSGRYLAYVPWMYSGGFKIYSLPASAVTLYSQVPDAEDFYSGGFSGKLIADAVMYHRPTDKPLLNWGVDDTIRARLEGGTAIQALFDEDGCYFVKTDKNMGFVKKEFVK